jgi:uncharacterized RDD family membrane protein YckC
MEVWIGRDGERHGPYTEADIRQWLASGEVSPADLGWYEGLADWQPLSVLFPQAQAEPSEAARVPPLPANTDRALDDVASFWKRVGAWVIDYLILLLPTAIIALAMGAPAAFEHFVSQVESGVAPIVAAADYSLAVRPAAMRSLLVGFIYYAFFECSKWQATPGKLALGLRVTDMDGQRLGFARSALRNAVRLANAITALIPLICYLTVAWTARHQGLHDLLAKTLVLNGRASDTGSTSTPPGSSNTFSA